jgi:lauroyl/myristoyl acyltransferase
MLCKVRLNRARIPNHKVRPTLGFEVGAALLRWVPTSVAAKAGSFVAKSARPLFASKAAVLTQNLAQAVQTDDAFELQRLTSSGFASYGRYWAESLKMPSLSAVEIDRGFSFVGLERIMEGLAGGKGVIIALPHLGGWEWAAAWLGRVMQNGVTAVVESLEPKEVFEWFAELRQSYDVEVVALGPKAGAEVMSALTRNRIVTLLSDRDISKNGVDVELFGKPTQIPGGPALLALRAGVPILPTAVYFRDHDRICVIDPEISTQRVGGLRADVARVSAELAQALEKLISHAPDQWHVLEPVWTNPVVEDPS